MSRILADLRHGARLLGRSPAVTVTALLALALAIGANTAMFSIVDAVLIRPLPYRDADRLAMVWEDASQIGFPRNTPAPANWADWRRMNSVFTDIAATRGWAYTITGDGPAERVLARRVTANLWTILGSAPQLGRTFTEDEDRGGSRVAVLSHGLWRTRFGGDPGIVGRKVLLSGDPFTVVGVMPAAFTFPNRLAQLWTPASFTPEDLTRRGSHFLQCVARLKPGVTLEQASAEMKRIAADLERTYPGTNRRVGAVVVPLREQMAGDTRTRLLVLFGAAGFVLLIACANVANLLLARAAARRREIAVRAALGAGRGAIVRQLLTESLLLAGAGALLGLGLARLAMRALETLVPPSMAALDLTLDWRVLAFTTIASVLTALLFGAAPAWSLGRGDLNEALKQGGRGSSGARREWLRDGLIVAQSALALSLLAGAGLMVQTLYNLRRVDLGMQSQKVLTLSTALDRNRYSDFEKRRNFYRAVLDRVERIPGVTAAGYTSDLPLTSIGNTTGYIVEGQAQVEANAQDALSRVVTPGFFSAVSARLREGRFFNEYDRPGGELAVIVNETMAERHWPRGGALGKRLSASGAEPWFRIVGVVREIRERGINIDRKPAVYLNYAQAADNWPSPGDLAVRTAGDPYSALAAVRQAIAEVDPDQPVTDIRTMGEVIEEQLTNERQQFALLAAFALLAVALAATGIYGVIAYLVSQQRREIGVRMALGARPGDILNAVLRRGALLAGAGTLLGLVLAIASAGLLSRLLYGVKPHDSRTLAAAALVLCLTALAACAAPARSAARVDPAIVLRDE